MIKYKRLLKTWKIYLTGTRFIGNQYVIRKENLDNSIEEIKSLQSKHPQSKNEPFGYVFNGRFYKTDEELVGYTMSKGNEPIPVFTQSEHPLKVNVVEAAEIKKLKKLIAEERACRIMNEEGLLEMNSTLEENTVDKLLNWMRENYYIGQTEEVLKKIKEGWYASQLNNRKDILKDIENNWDDYCEKAAE